MLLLRGAAEGDDEAGDVTLVLFRAAAGGGEVGDDEALELFRAAAWRAPPWGPHFLVSLFLGMQIPEQPAGSGALALAAWGVRKRRGMRGR